MTTDGGQVIEQVKAAFHETKAPPAAALMNGHCEECIETSWAFSQKRWDDLASEVGTYEETSLLTPEAWCYYLPTIMIWCIRDTTIVDVLLDNTVLQLTPPADPKDGWFEKRRGGFTSHQRRSIVAFLEWCRERWSGLSSDDTMAAREFWGTERQER